MKKSMFSEKKYVMRRAKKGWVHLRKEKKKMDYSFFWSEFKKEDDGADIFFGYLAV